MASRSGAGGQLALRISSTVDRIRFDNGDGAVIGDRLGHRHSTKFRRNAPTRQLAPAQVEESTAVNAG